MHRNELRRRSGVAIRLALASAEEAAAGGEAAWYQLMDYCAEMDDAALEDLAVAARTLDGAASDVLGRRHA